MRKTTRSSLLTITAFILAACNLAGSPPIPVTGDDSAIRLTVQTENNVSTFSQAGEIIHYRYAVTNTGTIPLAGPVIVTDNSREVACPALNAVGNLDGNLDLNESVTCTAAYTITEADFQDGSVTRLAVATAGGVTSNQSGITLTRAMVQPSSALMLVKTASSQTYSQVGATITYTYVITNTRTTPLGPVQFTVSDTKLGGPINCGPADVILAPGQTVTCQAPYVITQADMSLPSLTNSATASGGGETSAPAAATIVNASVQGTGTPGSPSVSGTDMPGPDVFALEQAAIENYPKANYEIVAPVSLKLNESFIVEMHMSRSRSGAELSTQIVTANALATSTSEAGTLVAPEGPSVRLEGGQVEVTPLMQVKLEAGDRDAFDIRDLHTSPIQVVDAHTTVKWQWVVQARKGGMQSLIFVISQQAQTNDEVHWHTLETQKRAVQVNVTMNQRLDSLDWKWLAGVFLTLLAIAAFWRWVDQQQKRMSLAERSRGRRGDAAVRSTPGNLLAQIPGRSKAEDAGQEKMGNIFISYRRSDSADIVGRIYDRLVDEFGPEPIFKDVDSIPLGSDFKHYLDRKVSECRVLLAIIGDRWVDAADETGKKRLDDRADFVRVEIESALKRDLPVIPLLVRGARMPAEEDLPYNLRRLVFKNGIEIRPDPDFHRDMDRLISALHEYL